MKTMTYNAIDQALNIESSIVEVDKTSEIEVSKQTEHIEKDYEYTRANLYT